MKSRFSNAYRKLKTVQWSKSLNKNEVGKLITSNTVTLECYSSISVARLQKLACTKVSELEPKSDGTWCMGKERREEGRERGIETTGHSLEKIE